MTVWKYIWLCCWKLNKKKWVKKKNLIFIWIVGFKRFFNMGIGHCWASWGDVRCSSTKSLHIFSPLLQFFHFSHMVCLSFHSLQSLKWNTFDPLKLQTCMWRAKPSRKGCACVRRLRAELFDILPIVWKQNRVTSLCSSFIYPRRVQRFLPRPSWEKKNCRFKWSGASNKRHDSFSIPASQSADGCTEEWDAWSKPNRGLYYTREPGCV